MKAVALRPNFEMGMKTSAIFKKNSKCRLVAPTPTFKIEWVWLIGFRHSTIGFWYITLQSMHGKQRGVSEQQNVSKENPFDEMARPAHCTAYL